MHAGQLKNHELEHAGHRRLSSNFLARVESPTNTSILGLYDCTYHSYINVYSEAHRARAARARPCRRREREGASGVPATVVARRTATTCSGKLLSSTCGHKHSNDGSRRRRLRCPVALACGARDSGRSPTMQDPEFWSRQVALDIGAEREQCGKHRRTRSHEALLALLDLQCEKAARQHVLPNALAQVCRHIAPLGGAPIGNQLPAGQLTGLVPVSPIQTPQREHALLPKPPSATVSMAPPAAAPVAAASTQAEVTGERTRWSPPRPSEEQLNAWPQELIKPLPAAVVAWMLLDSRYQPGHRPHTFCPLSGQFVFKECAAKRCTRANNDRWHNSGGKAGARDIQVKGGAVRVRRRYGSVIKCGSVAWCFHEYTLILRKVRKEPSADSNPTGTLAASPARTAIEETTGVMMAATRENGPTDEPQPAPTAAPALATFCEEWVEDRLCSVFHVMPSRLRGRPKRGEESKQAKMWAQLAPLLACKLSDACISNPEHTTGCVKAAFIPHPPPAQPEQPQLKPM